MNKQEIKELLHVASEVVVMAGDFISTRNQSGRKIRRDSGRDIKIIADIQSENIILKHLKRRSDFSILSEEKGLIKGRDEGFIWVVDPLDGTLNFSRKIPFCCVSIGLWKKDIPLLGAVYDFNRAELFSGITGSGAWLNNRLIKVSGTGRKEKAVLCTWFHTNTDFSSKGIQRFTDDIRSYKKTRLLGSAALSIVYVASGRVDAYQEENIMLWDIGGALPILLGAGGKLEMKRCLMANCFNVHVNNGNF